MHKNHQYLICLLSIVLSNASASTLTLSDAYRYAQKSNLAIKEAKLTWLANKNDENIALSYLLPQLSVTGTYNKNKSVYPENDQTKEVKLYYGERNTSMSLSQELFNMNSYFSYSQANQKVAQDLLTYQKELQALTLDVATQYFNLILEIENHNFLKTEESETLKRLQDVKLQVRHGTMTKAQLLEVKAQAKRVHAQIIEAKQRLLFQKDLLSDTIGFHRFDSIMSLGKSSNTLSLPIPKLAHWIQDTKQNNLSLKIAEKAVQQASYEEQANISNYIPTVSLSTSFNRHDYHSQSLKSEDTTAEIKTKKDYDQYSGQITISTPLYDGGKRFYNSAKAHQNLKRSKTSQKNTQQTIIRDVKNLYRRLNLSHEIMTSKEAALQSSREMLRIAKIGFNEGAITVLETLENISNVTKDHQSLEETKYHYLLDLLEILILSGIISPKDMDTINQDLHQKLTIPA